MEVSNQIRVVSMQFRVALGLDWENSKIHICLFTYSMKDPIFGAYLATRIKALRTADLKCNYIPIYCDNF